MRRATLFAVLVVMTLRLQAATIAVDGIVADGQGKPLAARGLIVRVTDSKGRPLAGVAATAVPSQRSEITLEEHLAYTNAPYGGRSDGAGRLTVDQVPSPLFDLLLTAPGFAPLVRERVESPRVASDLKLDLGTIALQPGLTLRGRVEDPAGRPIAGASIHCHRFHDRFRWLEELPGSRELIHSAADGSFEIRDLASDMRVLLTVDRDGYETTQVTAVTLPKGGIERVTMRRTSTP